MHVLCCITLLVYACMTILHSLFQMLKFNSIVINAWPFYSLYSFIPPHPTPPLFIYSTVLVSVLFWVPCKVASWLKASPGEIRYPYHTIPYYSLSMYMRSDISTALFTPYCLPFSPSLHLCSFFWILVIIIIISCFYNSGDHLFVYFLIQCIQIKGQQ